MLDIIQFLLDNICMDKRGLIDRKRLGKDIAEAVRAARKERRFTQQEVAALLGLSQSRYSEIESGNGSFTAEQLVMLMQRFNLPLDHFIGKAKNENVNSQLQNALSRLGAEELMEDSSVLPSERLSEVNDVVAETIISASTARHVTALAPVFIMHANNINFREIRNRLQRLEMEGRLWWIVESTIEALKKVSDDMFLPKDRRLFSKALIVLDGKTITMREIWFAKSGEHADDILDEKDIASKKTFEEIIEGRSKLARKWKIVTRITTNDFIDAIRWSR